MVLVLIMNAAAFRPEASAQTRWSPQQHQSPGCSSDQASHFRWLLQTWLVYVMLVRSPAAGGVSDGAGSASNGSRFKSTLEAAWLLKRAAGCEASELLARVIQPRVAHPPAVGPVSVYRLVEVHVCLCRSEGHGWMLMVVLQRRSGPSAASCQP